MGSVLSVRVNDTMIDYMWLLTGGMWHFGIQQEMLLCCTPSVSERPSSLYKITNRPLRISIHQV